jgi:hypothetical protein
MCRFKYIFALTVIAGIASTAAQTRHPPTHEEIAQGRDLKLYDDGGDYIDPDDSSGTIGPGENVVTSGLLKVA